MVIQSVLASTPGKRVGAVDAEGDVGEFGRRGLSGEGKLLSV